MRQTVKPAEGIEPYLTPPEIAKLLRVSREKVVGWIRRGELLAVDVGSGTRSRYRVSRGNLDLFLERRSVRPAAPRVRANRRPPEGGPIDPTLGEKLVKKGQATRVGNKYYRVWEGMTLFY